MIVDLNSVGKSYFTEEIETRALADVTMQINEGEYVAIEGPSGCGKTTLLSIIGLLDKPTLGGYKLNGRATESLTFTERAKVRNREIGFIFQNFNLIGDLTIYENIELPLVYRGMPRDERAVHINEILARTHISHRAKHYPMQLSGGEQQRAAVARALVGDPSILLADEPTGNLDTRNGEAIMDLLTELHQGGSTIVMVTHDFRFARQAKRTIGLLDGQLVEESVAARTL